MAVKFAKVIRSQFSPPGQVIVSDLENEKTLILPPETSDETLARAEKMVEAYNKMVRDIETLRQLLNNGS